MRQALTPLDVHPTGLTKGYLSYRGRSVDSLAMIGATIKATIAKRNKAVSTEVSRGHSNQETSRWIKRMDSQNDEGLNVVVFQML
jgi:hypothetical protein